LKASGASFFKKATSKRSAYEGQEKLKEALGAGLKKDYTGAVAILEEAISEYETPPEAYLYLGRSLHVLKHYSRALAAYNDYLRICPRSPEGFFYAGRTYLTMGMPHRAVSVLRKALDLDAADPLIPAFLGIAYLKSKHSQQAVDMLQRAVETAAKQEDTPASRRRAVSEREQRRIYRAYLNALLIRGIRLCRQENYELGIQMLGFVLENGLDGPLLRLELGRACRETGELEEALEHYTRALEYAPQDPRIRWYRASVLMTAGLNAEALQEIAAIRSLDGREKLPDLPWNSELVDRFMIRSFLEGGQWRRAAESCRSWLKTRGSDAMVHTMYAEAQRNLEEYPAALNHLERALEMEPERVEIWYEWILTAWEGRDWKKLKKGLRILKKLGGDRRIGDRFSVLCEAAQGEDDGKVIRQLQRAIHSQGPEPELMYALGERYLKVGFLEQARSWFAKITMLQENHERAYLGEIAACEALLGEGDAGAEEALRKAYEAYLARWPDNHLIRRDRALFLVRQGIFAEAAAELESLLAWEPANPTLRRVLAYTYRKTGRFREAAVFLKALLKERPRNLPLVLEFSGCLARAGAPFYAVSVLEKAMEYFKHSSEIPAALAMLFYREQKFERAFDLFREALERNPGDPRPYLWMAAIARKNGDADEAARYEGEAKKRQKAAL
jgi:tetratricopeptide (TPR) repeat protein